MSAPLPSIAERLLAWFAGAQRDLPWRKSADPWAIWVSEAMLQQTRVEVVRHAFPRFLARFPSPAALAAASDDDLLRAWEGLGYYRRARLLREASRQVERDHAGRVPVAVPDLLALPGVGDYTAGAIASIAFGAAVVAIDGNVERVAARHAGLDGNVKHTAVARRIRDVVTGWLDPKRAGDFNQALMELGALVCLPRAPECQRCPLADDCVARANGTASQLPRLPERRAAVDVVARAVLAPAARGRILATRIPEDAINAGQIDLPGGGVLVAVAEPAELEAVLRRRFGVAFRVGGVVTTVHHAITHHRVRLVVHEATCTRGPGPNLMAVRPDDRLIPWTTVARKVFRQAALFLTARQ